MIIPGVPKGWEIKVTENFNVIGRNLGSMEFCISVVGKGKEYAESFAGMLSPDASLVRLQQVYDRLESQAGIKFNWGE